MRVAVADECTGPNRRAALAALVATVVLCSVVGAPAQTDPRLSWNDGGAEAIIDFAAREYAYDRQSKIGKLDKALDAATAGGWTVIDMKQDWKEIFPPLITTGAAKEAKP